MKKAEIIEILKETIYIDGNRGTHQYWITGIEKAANRLTEQPEGVSEEKMRESLENLYDKYKQKGRMQFIDVLMYYIATRLSQSHPQPISEERIEEIAKKAVSEDLYKDHSGFTTVEDANLSKRILFIKGFRAALKELNKQ